MHDPESVLAAGQVLLRHQTGVHVGIRPAVEARVLQRVIAVMLLQEGCIAQRLLPSARGRTDDKVEEYASGSLRAAPPRVSSPLAVLRRLGWDYSEDPVCAVGLNEAFPCSCCPYLSHGRLAQLEGPVPRSSRASRKG